MISAYVSIPNPVCFNFLKRGHKLRHESSNVFRVLFTLRTLPCRARMALRKRKTVKNAHELYLDVLQTKTANNPVMHIGTKNVECAASDARVNVL